jgi:hypothetical protein
MKVIVKAVVAFEVDVDSHDRADATRAVLANWSTVYKHQARPAGGVAPHLQDGRVIDVLAEWPEAPAKW